MIKEVVFIVIILLANAVQAITGFAGTALAMPVSTALLGNNVARPVLNVVALAISLVVVYKHKKSIELKPLRFMGLFMGVGMALGLGLKTVVNIEDFNRFYGLFIIVIALYFLVQKKVRSYPLALNIAIVTLAGMIHAWYLTGGPLLIIFAVSQFSSKESFRATLSLLWLGLNSIVLISDISQGLYTHYVLVISSIALLSIPASYIIGQWLFLKMNVTVFMRITYLLLMLSGITLLL